MKKTAFVTAIVMALTVMTASVAVAHDGPTCSSGTPLGDLATHGQHIIGDYVTGNGSGTQAWPPQGTVGGGGGVAVAGGPGPGFHFTIGAPPGASFCNDANSGVIYTNPGQGRPQNP